MIRIGMIKARMVIIRATLLLSGLFISFVLAACVTTQPAAPKSSKTGLEPQTLETGECGLFVWAASPEKPFILFSQSAKASGLWYNERVETLVITANSGDASYQQFPQTIYQRKSGETLELSLFDAQPIDDGMRYKSGTLRYMTEAGWQKIVPVIGMAACQI